MNKKIIVSLFAVFAVASALLAFKVGFHSGVDEAKNVGLTQSGGRNQSACEMTTASSTIVGYQESKLLVSASSTRAWLRVSQPDNATNTVYLAYNGGPATLNTTSFLDSVPAGSAGATTSDFRIYGLGTENPYVGAIYGITSSASSTVLIEQCNYR